MPLSAPKPMKKGVRAPLTEEQLKAVFTKHDADGNGLLSKEELKEAFKYLGTYFPGWRAGKGLRYADANGDGNISEEELDAVVKYAAKFGYSVK